jgi:CheY-like chemotaxis protein
VFGFAKQSGGHVTLYSEPGHGTTVRLYLPRSAEPAADPARARTAAPPDSPGAGRPGRVLVVEDDEAVRETVVTLLRALGHQVHKARDGADALAQLQAGLPVDLLFTDVVMPGQLSSTELAGRARALRPGLQVLFTSGYTENALQHGGRLAPGVQLLSKPYTLDALQRKLARLLDDPAPASALPSAPPAGPLVLLCEDDDLVRDALADLLDGMGCQVCACASLAEAQAALQARLPQVLITDLRLPDGDGLVLAQAARALSPGMVIAVASGRGGRAAATQVHDAVLLEKPFGIDALEALLARLPRA